MKRLLLAFLGLLLTGPLAAQAPFVRTLAAPALSTGTLRVVAMADGGSAVFVGDSVGLVRLSSCGRVEWARRYRFAGLTLLPYLHNCIGLADGGFAFVTRAQVGLTAEVAPFVVRLDAAGAVRWSQLVREPGFEPYPYTIGETATGDLVIYGNLSLTGGGTTFNFLTQLSPTGALRWARRYNLGGIWGGALLTRDGGILARTGERFIKTDPTGAVEWTSYVSTPGTESYFTPVEVADGYVLTLYATAMQQVGFAKLDRQGQLVGGTRQVTTLRGRLAPPRPGAGGRVVALVNQTDAIGAAAPTLVELDADLRVTRQHWLGGGLSGSDCAIGPTGAPVLVGRTPSGVFVAQATAAWQLACDTALAPVSATAVATAQSFITTTALPTTPTLLSFAAVVSSFNPVQTTRCSTPPTLDLGPDTVVCDAAPVSLRNRRATLFESYAWSTGATTPTLTATAAGTYWLRAITNCGLDTLTDTIRIARPTVPPPPSTRDTIRCSDEPVWLDARVPGPATYRWPDGSTDPRYSATDTGRYVVTINLEGCSRQVAFRVSECERLVLPNIFTPGPAPDGLNDRFVPIEMRGIASATLEVYSRWGRRLFSTADLRTGWDGTLGGRRAGAGTYFWLVRYTTVRGRAATLKGWVELAGR